MPEKEPHQEKIPEIAFIQPLEMSFSIDGSREVLLEVSSSSESSEKKAIEALRNSGVEVEKVDSPTNRELSRKSFGFGKWNALWDPTGPKPNWAELKDPSKN